MIVAVNQTCVISHAKIDNLKSMERYLKYGIWGENMYTRKKVLLYLMIFTISFVQLTGITAVASNTNSQAEADALHYLGLFLGTDKGYELEKSLTRAEAITMVVRFVGEEEDAPEYAEMHPFSDVPEWADAYVGYSYANAITNGYSETIFAPNEAVTRQQFLTFMLRVLGYSDSAGEFQWDKPEALALQLGLIESTSNLKDIFLREDMVEICWRVLGAAYKNSKKTLAEQLIEMGVITTEEYEFAQTLVSGEKTVPENDDNPQSGSNENQNDEFTVTFCDFDNTVLSKQTVKVGSMPVLPENPTLEGNIFIGWDREFQSVSGDQTITAMYTDADSKNIFLLEVIPSADGKSVVVTLALQGAVEICGFDLRLNYNTQMFSLNNLDVSQDLYVVAKDDPDEGQIAFNYGAASNISKGKSVLSASFDVIGTSSQIGTFNLTPIEIIAVDPTNGNEPVQVDYVLTSRAFQIEG